MLKYDLCKPNVSVCMLNLNFEIGPPQKSLNPYLEKLTSNKKCTVYAYGKLVFGIQGLFGAPFSNLGLKLNKNIFIRILWYKFCLNPGQAVESGLR